MPNSPVRVLLVDDSPLVLTILRRILGRSQDVKVVGTASQGREALDLIREIDPQVVCTDLEMPIMDGLELTRQIMSQDPRPILVVSGVVGEEHADNVFRLLQAGALDVFPKPRGGSDADYDRIAAELVRKIRILSGVRVIRKRSGKVFSGASRRAGRPPLAGAGQQAQVQVITIGASTGGPLAYQTVLAALPVDFPVPIVCVQHIGVGFLSGLVKWLATHCRVQIKVAEHHEAPEAGTVYFAPEARQLLFDGDGRFEAVEGAPFEGHCPSATVTMQSAARRFGEHTIGVLLSGMGRDGAEGLQEIVQAGGGTLVQDRETCVVYGMPQRAVEIGAAQQVLPLEKIPGKLKQLCARQFR